MNLTEEEQWQMFLDVNAESKYELRSYILGKKSPFVVICPGGGYEMVAAGIEGDPYAKKLNALGYSAFVLYYHTKAGAQAPQPMDDLARAIRYILDNAEELNVDRQQFSIWGSSAGGHLAASFGTKALGYEHYKLPKPSVLVLAYPVISMQDSLGHQGSRERLLGKEADPALKLAYSIESQVDSGYPPTFVWNCVTDEVVPPENSHALFEALCKKSIPCKFCQYSEGYHGSGLSRGELAESWFDDAASFMNKYMA